MLNLPYMGKLHIDQPKCLISGRVVSSRKMPRSTFSLDVVDCGSLSPQRIDLWELPLIIDSLKIREAVSKSSDGPPQH